MVRARNKKNPKPKMRERRSRKWSLNIKILKKRKKPSHYYWIFKDDDIPEVGRSHTPYFQFRQKKKSLMKLSHSPVDQCQINSERIQIMPTEQPDCDRSGKEEQCASSNGERVREQRKRQTVSAEEVV
jgi:hypothetical protein